MVIMRNVSMALLIQIVSFSLSAHESYIVQEKESLSKILFDKGIGPIYGAQGYLEVTLNLNPSLKSTNGDVLTAGTLIFLPRTPPVKVEDSVLETVKLSEVINEITPETERIIRRVATRPASSLSRSDLEVQVTSRYIRINSKDLSSNADAQFISNAGVGYKLLWKQRWNKLLKTSLAYESYNIEILELNPSSLKMLNNRKQNLKSYELGLAYSFYDRLISNTNIFYGDSLVNRAADANIVQFEKFVSPKFSTGFDFTLASQDNLKLSTKTALVVNLPQSQGDYISKVSLGYLLGVGVQDKFYDFAIKGDIAYKYLPLKMESLKFDQREVMLMISIAKSFGERNE